MIRTLSIIGTNSHIVAYSLKNYVASENSQKPGIISQGAK